MLRKSKGLLNGLGLLQVFIGLGAVAGGLGLVLEPSGANLGMPLEALEHSPFSTYLIPGIVLFVLNGFGCLSRCMDHNSDLLDLSFSLASCVVSRVRAVGAPSGLVAAKGLAIRK